MVLEILFSSMLIVPVIMAGIVAFFFFGIIFFVSIHQRMRWLLTGEIPPDKVDEMIVELLQHLMEERRAARIVARERRLFF